MDLIDRYQRIDAAIVASNAATWIETSYGHFTVAGAISLRSRLRAKGMIYAKGTDFEGLLQSVLEAQYNSGVQVADERNKALEKQAETMRLSILGKDGKARDDKPLEVVEAYVKENTTELVDPLGAEKRKRLADRSAGRSHIFNDDHAVAVRDLAPEKDTCIAMVFRFLPVRGVANVFAVFLTDCDYRGCGKRNQGQCGTRYDHAYG